MFYRILLALQCTALLLTFVTSAHAGHNGVQVHSLSPSVRVLAYDSKQGKGIKVLGESFIDATLSCTTDGFRAKYLGPNSSWKSKQQKGSTKIRRQWSLRDEDLQKYSSAIINSCKTGNKTLIVNYLPKHACYRKKGIASPNVVHQSKKLTIQVECAAVGKTFYKLPHKSCSPVGNPAKTKTGHRVKINCMNSKPAIGPQPAGIQVEYADAVNLNNRRVSIPPGCKATLQRQRTEVSTFGGLKRLTGMKIGVNCEKFRRKNFNTYTMDGVQVQLVRTLKFSKPIMPWVPLPDGCSQDGNTWRFNGGRWVKLSCGSKHGSLKPVSYIEKHSKKKSLLIFVEDQKLTKYSPNLHHTPGPLAPLPKDCIQFAYSTGGGPAGATTHTVQLWCRKGAKVPSSKKMGKSTLKYQVKGTTPSHCTPIREAGLGVVMVSCNPASSCQNTSYGTPAIACAPQGD